MSRFLLGINYWPRQSAMYMWQRFDLDEIGEDMARIKALGLDVVRFFLDVGRLPAGAQRDGRRRAAPLRCGDETSSPRLVCARCRRSFAAT